MADPGWLCSGSESAGLAQLWPAIQHRGSLTARKLSTNEGRWIDERECVGAEGKKVGEIYRKWKERRDVIIAENEKQRHCVQNANDFKGIRKYVGGKKKIKHSEYVCATNVVMTMVLDSQMEGGKKINY